MLFTILYIVMSMNRFDTKLWLLLNSVLGCFVQLKEKYAQISKFVLGFQAPLYMENGWDKIYNHDIYFVYL